MTSPLRLARTLAATAGVASMAIAAPAQDAPGAADAGSNGNVSALVRDVAAHELCPRIEGGFYALSGEGEGAPVTGRLWVRECNAREASEGMTVAVSGVGWRWVERARERFGARFELEDTVQFQFQLDARAKPALEYDPGRHVAVLRLEPVSSPDVSVTALGETEVEEKGAWADLLGAAATAAGMSPEQQGEEAFSGEARRSFRRSLREGISAAYDLCTGRVTASMGRIRPGDLEEPKLEPAPPDWSSSAAVRLHANAFDVAGPFSQNGEPLHARIEVARGTLRAALVCEEDAHAMARRYVEREAMPSLAARAEERIPAGTTRTLRVEQRSCPLALVGLPAEGAETPVEYRFLVYGDGEPEPLVSCPE